jgi:hypothetical protein
LVNFTTLSGVQKIQHWMEGWTSKQRIGKDLELSICSLVGIKWLKKTATILGTIAVLWYFRLAIHQIDWNYLTETNLRCRTIWVTGMYHMCSEPYWLTCAERRYVTVPSLQDVKPSYVTRISGLREAITELFYFMLTVHQKMCV